MDGLRGTHHIMVVTDDRPRQLMNPAGLVCEPGAP